MKSIISKKSAILTNKLTGTTIIISMSTTSITTNTSTSTSIITSNADFITITSKTVRLSNIETKVDDGVEMKDDNEIDSCGAIGSLGILDIVIPILSKME